MSSCGFLALRHRQHDRHDGDQHHENVEGERNHGRLADRQVVLTTLEGDYAFEPVDSRRIGPERGEDSRGNRHTERGAERRGHLVDAGAGTDLGVGQA